MRRRQKKRENGFVQIEFANADELFEYVSNVPDWALSKSIDPGYCRYSWDETIDALRFGWKDGTKQLLSVSDQITARMGEVLSTWGTRYDVTGEYIDMGRYVVGEPECCGSIVRDTQMKPVVNVTVNIAMLCDIDQDAFTRRGAVILSLVEELRKDHIVMVKIYARSYDVSRDKHNKYDFYSIFGINTANDFSRDMLATYLAHPGIFRRITLAIRERFFNNTYLECYGKTDHGFSPEEEPGEKYVHFKAIRCNSDWQYLEENVQWIAEQLNRLRNEENKKNAA